MQKESDLTEKLPNMVLQYNGSAKIAAYRDDEQFSNQAMRTSFPALLSTSYSPLKLQNIHN